MTPPKDYAKTLKFRSMLSRTMRDGVTTPCGRSLEHEAAVRCAKAKMDKDEPDKACLNCASALKSSGGKGKKKKGKKGARR